MGDQRAPYAVRAKGLKVDGQVNTGVGCLYHWIGLDSHLYKKNWSQEIFDFIEEAHWQGKE